MDAVSILQGQNYSRIARVTGFAVSHVSYLAKGRVSPRPFTLECIKGALERIAADPDCGKRKHGRPKKHA